MEPTAQSGGATQYSQPTIGGMPPGADPLVAASMHSAQSAATQPVAPVQAAPVAPVQFAATAQTTMTPAQPVTSMQSAQPMQPMQPMQPVQPAQPVQPMQSTQSAAEPMGAMDFGGTAGAGTSVGMETKDISSLIDKELAKPVAPVSQEAMAPVEPMKKPAKKVNGMLIGLIASAVVAVFGITFGVIMMAQKTDIETRLNKQISSLKNQVSELSAQVEALQNEAANDYMEVSEWDMKIAIPTELKFVSYEVKQEQNGDSVLTVTGVADVDGTIMEAPTFANLSAGSTGLVSVMRTTGECQQNTFIMDDGSYSYCIVPRTDVGLVSEDSAINQLYADSVALAATVFANPDNYLAL